MYFSIDTFFAANKNDLGRAYERYSQVVGKASTQLELDILFISDKPTEIDDEGMLESLVDQFKIERPEEDFHNLRLYLCSAILSATEEYTTSDEKFVTSFFLMDEEDTIADDFPSMVGFRRLLRWEACLGNRDQH